jgi:hypothetical protein
MEWWKGIGRMEGWKDGRGLEGWKNPKLPNPETGCRRIGVPYGGDCNAERTGEGARPTIWRFPLGTRGRVPGGLSRIASHFPITDPNFPSCSLWLCGEIPLRDL